MKVIVPCCGRSTRFPNQPPKWMLPGHDGRPMLALAISGLALRLEDVVVAILREHEERFRVIAGLKELFGRPLNVVIHEEPTASQADTVVKTLARLGLEEPFLIKDSDNVFTLDELEQEHNYVSVDSLNNFDSINPRNKSYLQIDHKGAVTNIREKVVISDLFSVGGYYFTRPAQFVQYHDRLVKGTASWNRELYISDIIGAMILDGIPFRARQVSGYQDWGTVHEWRRALLARRAYLAVVDGFVLERGSPFFHPRFEEVKPHTAAVQTLKGLAEQGNTVLYLSIRPPELAKLTEGQLAAAGAPAGQVLYGCPVASMTLVAAPHATLPFRTAHAVELGPDDANLDEKLRGES
jgi:dTDP-glucose pyrophosphorylase